MCPPCLGVGDGDEGQSNVTLPPSASSAESILYNSSELRAHNYMGFSDCSSSVDSSAISIASEESRSNMNLKATELRLGLPGSQSPEREAKFGLLSSSTIDEKQLFRSHFVRDGASSSSHKSIVSGNKRVFSDAMSIVSEGNFLSNSNVNVVLLPRASFDLAVKSSSLKEIPVPLSAKINEATSAITVQENVLDSGDCSGIHMGAPNVGRAPAPKAQVVGWPPIQSFRKNSLATTSKNNGEIDGDAGPSGLFVKVRMDGAPYLRKVNLKAYSTYQKLSSALEEMFSCITIVVAGQCTSHLTTEREMLNENKLKDLVHGSEYVLTYEDKDGDWMLVGDVPWEMFINTSKRLRIMKSSDAIGLGMRMT